MVFALCYSYDKRYSNQDSPDGIILQETSDNYEIILEKLKKVLVKRQGMDEDYGCGWSKEFRICLLEIDDNDKNKIKKILASDFRNNDFWDEQVKNYKNVVHKLL